MLPEKPSLSLRGYSMSETQSISTLDQESKQSLLSQMLESIVINCDKSHSQFNVDNFTASTTHLQKYFISTEESEFKTPPSSLVDVVKSTTSQLRVALNNVRQYPSFNQKCQCSIRTPTRNKKENFKRINNIPQPTETTKKNQKIENSFLIQNKENQTPPLNQTQVYEQKFQAIKSHRPQGLKVETNQNQWQKQTPNAKDSSYALIFDERIADKTITFGSSNSSATVMTFNRYYKEHLEKDISTINFQIQDSLEQLSDDDLDY